MEVQEDLTSLTMEELLARRADVERDIAKFNTMQLAYKVSLNSAYGALG